MDDFEAKDKLKKYIERAMNGLFGSILDYAEVAVDGKDRYQAFRTRILKMGNEKLRGIEHELDVNYNVSELNQEVIRFSSSKKS